MKRRLTLTMILIQWAGLPFAALAQVKAGAFLDPKQAASEIADGRAWAARTGDGKDVTITLNGDGTGTVKGPMPFPMSVAWQVKGEAICLALGPAGRKCIRFRRIDVGYQGWNEAGPDLILRR